MTAALLLSYAVVAATLGHRALRRVTWLDRAPRAGIVAWQALGCSAVLAAGLGGLAAWLPAWPRATSLAHFLDACATLLRDQYATPGGAITSTAGAALALAVLARVAHAFTRRAVLITRGRAAQRRQLAVLARDEAGLLVLDHDHAAAYCVPGRRNAVVVTSAAMDCLDDAQLAAVMAHEHAHLRGRHDVVVAGTAALADAFPFLPAFRVAATEVARLVELRADDVAARSAGRLPLATALVRLAEASTPAGALGAGGASTVGRVRRLAQPADGIGPLRPVGLLVGGAVAVAAPLVVATAPALAVAASGYCPLPTL